MVELLKNIKSGRYIPIPNIYSNDLKKIIALMLQINPKKRISSEELFNLPIINSKINKNYSKYKDLIEKLKKPEIIGTILPQEKILPKKKITNRNKCRNISKNKSKSKGKNPPISPKKKKVINKNKDINSKDRSSSAKKNNLRNINPIIEIIPNNNIMMNIVKEIMIIKECNIITLLMSLLIIVNLPS
jgi:serine/threonine protein kinase